MFSQLPSEIIVEILSYLVIDVEFVETELEFFKYYFGRFKLTETIGFLFTNLNWTNARERNSKYSWQIIRLEQVVNRSRRRIDLDKPYKHYVFAPDCLISQEEFLGELDQFLIDKGIDSSTVKSILLTNAVHPVYVCRWILENFTSLETVLLNFSYTSWAFQGRGIFEYFEICDFSSCFSNLRNLTRLEIECEEDEIHNELVKISTQTPHVQVFKCKLRSSIFLASPIFVNWKNLKHISSRVIAGGYSLVPTDTEIVLSFSAIENLEQLEKISLIGEPIDRFGVPFCKSITSMRLGISFGGYTTKLVKSISNNSNLRVLNFKSGSWSKEIFNNLDFEKLKHLQKFSMYNISNNICKHLSKFSSITEIDAKYAEIDNNGLEYLLGLPNLKRIRYSEAFSHISLNLDEITNLGKVKLEEIC